MNLATVLKSSAHHETALAYFQEALRVMQIRLGKDAATCASVLVQIGDTMRALKRYEEAQPEIAGAMRVLDVVYGACHIEMGSAALIAMGDLALDQQQLDEAMQYFDQALKLYRSTYGGEDGQHKDIALALHRSACVLLQQARPAEALKSFRSALPMRIRFNGECHIDVAATLREIGAAMQAQADLDGAIEHYARALSIYEKVFEWIQSFVSFRNFVV